MALDPNAQAGQIRTLISQILGGTSAPTGIGSSRPASLGPNPVRSPEIGAGGIADQSNLNLQSIYSLLAPYLALLGGQGGAGTLAGGGSGTDVVTQFLTHILNSIAGIPNAAGAPGMPAPAAAGGAGIPAGPSPTASLFSSPTSAATLESAASEIGGTGGGDPSTGHEVLR